MEKPNPQYFIFKGIKIPVPPDMPQSKIDIIEELIKFEDVVIQNNIPKDVMQAVQDAMRAELIVPSTGEPIGPKKPFMPTLKMILTDEESYQLETIKKTFPETTSIIMYEEDSVIQIDFDGTPVIHPDTIRNLEDRGYSRLAEFPCKCNCGGYSLLMARNF